MNPFDLPESPLPLGNFSVSISVKDIQKSKAFYEALGFVATGGMMDQNWVILRNGPATIGLFQGMFEGNMLTFNPGWSPDGNHPADGEFKDIREIQASLKDAGIALLSEVESEEPGPANIMLTDPDGNMILLDQHR